MITKLNDINLAIKLIKDVYLKTEAKNDTKEGINEFLNNYTKTNDDQVFYGYYYNNMLVGVASINNIGYIKYLFVNPSYKNKKIGSSLLQYVMNLVKLDTYTLDSSIYAYDFYVKMGFKKTNNKQTINGMSYIPMKYERSK